MAGESVSAASLSSDDELHVRDLLRDVLTTMGDEVVTVATGAEALEVVPTFQPDVILVDMVMPGLSGTDVLDALRRTGVTVPVILISGYPMTAHEGSSMPSKSLSIYGSWPRS